MAKLSLAEFHRLFPAEQNIRLMVLLFVFVALGLFVSCVEPNSGAPDWVVFYVIFTVIAVFGLMTALYEITFPRTTLDALQMWPASVVMIWCIAVIYFGARLAQTIHPVGVH